MKRLLYQSFMVIYKGLLLLFLLFLVFYGISALINYIFWAYFSTSSSLQFEVRQHFGNLENILSGRWRNIFDILVGHIVTLPKALIALYIIFFQGNGWFANVLNILLGLGIVLFIYKLLRFCKTPMYLTWIIVFWAMLMVFEPGNLYTLGPEHAMWLYLYFMVALDLFLFTKIETWVHFSFIKKAFYHIILIVLLLLTSITFTPGLLIWGIVVGLFLLKKSYKFAVIYGFALLIYMLGIYGIYYNLVNSYAGNHELVSNPNYWELIRYMFANFATPTSLNKHNYLDSYSIITYVRASLVMLLTLWVLFFALLKPVRYFFQSSKIKKKLESFDYFNLFFLGLVLFSLANIAILILFRHHDDRASGGGIIHPRFYLNFNMFSIGLFALISKHLSRFKAYFFKFFLMVITVFYVIFVLIHYGTKEIDYNYADSNKLYVIETSMGRTDSRIYGNLFKRFWNLEGYHVWQKELLHTNIYKLMDSSKRIDIVNKKTWFVEDSPCKTCVLYFGTLKKFNGKFGNIQKEYSTIKFIGFGKLPYYFSETLFITNKQGDIMGWGYKILHDRGFLTIFSIIPYIQNMRVEYSGYFYDKNFTKTQEYTLWDIAFNRKSISRLLTFSLHPKPNVQIHKDDEYNRCKYNFKIPINFLINNKNVTCS